ncbi:MAG TPA: serine/threonine protein kinase, partial [Deltaproteobacteria bacterium]|nr:serine/threonine protein kinase [Deltaproteobacteria bacterium]
EAEDPGLRRRVALKVLLAGSFARARDIERFLREARAVARLDHPNIVKILEFDREGGGAWFAMEYVDGPNLLRRIRHQGALPWREAVDIAARLARALQHAHEQGLVHRDVKPNNVLLEDGNRPRLTDFGLALRQDEGEGTRLTRTGQVLGTPMYMSPEAASGDLGRIGPHTDVYGVGVVLYEMLTGKVPFEGSTPLAIIGAVLQGNPAPPRHLVPDIPRPVEIACLKAMRSDPADRYATAERLAEDLQRCLRGEPIQAAPPSLRARLRWFARRNRTALGIATAALLASLAVGMGSTVALRTRASTLARAREASALDNLRGVLARIDQLEAGGQPDEAERAWQAFVHHPQHRGTLALVDGWLARADHLHKAGDAQGRLAALGMAYAAAGRSRDQERALLALARGLREERRLDRLQEVVDTLRRRAPELARRPEVLRLHRDALAAQRDLKRAAAVGGEGPIGRVLDALAKATPTPHHADEALPWPGSDGALLLRHGGSDRLQLVGATPGLEGIRSLRIPLPAQRIAPLSGDRALLVVGTDHGVSLLRESQRRLQHIAGWGGGPLLSSASGDLDGDGRVEHYLGLGRELLRLKGHNALYRDVPHPPTNASRSTINDLLVADVDQDGRDELIVAAGEWGAYDVRILGMDDDVLSIRARSKLGVVEDLAALPDPEGRITVLAAKVDRYPNLQMFPPEAATGQPPGLWRLSLQDGALEQRRVLSVGCDRLTVGDLDGDGLHDVAAQCGDDLLLMVQSSDGKLRDVWIQQLTLLAMVDVDPDPAMELVVADPDADEAVWVLGVGAEAPPTLLPTHHRAQPPPAGADPASADAWRRAEDLVYIGQIHQAADALEALAELQWGRSLGWEAVLRAADLHHARGAWAEAASLYLSAVDEVDEPTAIGALRAAAKAWRQEHALEEELAVLRRLRDAGALDDDEARRLTVLVELADPPRAELTFDRPLDPHWRIDDPLALQRLRDQGLRIEAFGDGTLAHVPVRWSVGVLELELELELERTEWDGGVEIGLAPRGWEIPDYSVTIEGQGGGEVVWPRLVCVASEHKLEQPLPGGERLVVRLQLFANREGLSCGVEGPSIDWRGISDTRLPDPPEEDWDLVIRATGGADTGGVVILHRITLEGATLAPDPPPGRDHARQALVDGDPKTAAGRRSSMLLDDPLLEAAIAAERDDGEALRAALQRLVEQGRADKPLLHLLHHRIDALGAELRPLLGPDWPWWIARAWDTTLHAHSTDPELVSVLLSHLDGLLEADTDRLDRIATLVLLNARRGAAALSDDRLELAGASFERALALHRRLPSARAMALAPTIAGVHLDRAALAVRTGAPAPEALAALDRALQSSPAPEIIADMASVRPDLAALRTEAGWAERIEPLRRGTPR